MMSLELTNAWFAPHAAIWDQVIPKFKLRRYLEVGSYEGASLCHMLQKHSHDASFEAHVIDTWLGSVEHHADAIDMNAVEQRFLRNLELTRSQLQHEVKVVIHKGHSHLHLARLISTVGPNYFDCIYIDGSHQAHDVLADLSMAFILLRRGGLLICDDYLWYEPQLAQGKDLLRCPKPAIDAFVNINWRRLNIINGVPLYQLFMQKLVD